ncbi:MAG: hypothetical protein Q9213_008241 [Squamulea squamosa]
MQLDFAEYAKVASQAEPTILDKTASSLSLPLSSVKDSSNAESVIGINEKLKFMAYRLKDGHSKLSAATKWALFDRQHLQNIVVKFKKRNETLRRILQFAMAGILQQIAQPGPGLQNLQQDKDAVALGLTTWAEIKEIKDHPERLDRNFSLDNCTVDTVDDALVLRRGTVTTRLGKSSMWTKGKITQKAVFVEYKTLPTVPQGLDNLSSADLDARVNQRISQLANLLSTAGSHCLGTLPFKGFIKEPDQRRYAFLFEAPDSASIETKPESLHQMIESPVLSRLWSLSARFKLAFDLARTMGTFHMFEWVVKGFQSHSVIFCYESQNSKLQLDKPYLAGFEYIRPVSGSTVGQPLDTHGRNMLYCHPILQEEPRLDFSKIHDVYSLGVVLLEIGLWSTARQLLQIEKLATPGEIRAEYIRKAATVLISYARR